MFGFKLALGALLALSTTAHFTVPNDDQDMSGLVVNGIPYSTRVKYMRLVLLFHLPHPFSTYPNTQPIGQRSPLLPKRALPLRRLRHHNRKPHLRQHRLPRRQLPHRRPNITRRDLRNQRMHRRLRGPQHDAHRNLRRVGRAVSIHECGIVSHVRERNTLGRVQGVRVRDHDPA